MKSIMKIASFLAVVVLLNSPHAQADGVTGAQTVTVGASATGAAPVGNPVQIAGVSSNNGLIHPLALDSKGRAAGSGSARTTGRKCYAMPFQLGSAVGAIAAVEAPAGTEVVIRKIVLFFPGLQTTAGVRTIEVLRTTTAGVGGEITPYLHSGDAYGGIVRLAASGTLGGLLALTNVYIPSTNGPFTPIILLDSTDLRSDGIVIPAGVANGIVIYDMNGGAGANGSGVGTVFFDTD